MRAHDAAVRSLTCRRYAEAGLTELFLEANFDPTGPRVERVIDVMDALAPEPENG